MNNKLKKVIVIAVLAIMVCLLEFLSASMADAASSTYTVAGDSGLCGSNWDPSINEMTEGKYEFNGDEYTYKKVFNSINSGDYNFKVTDGTFNNVWGNGEQNYQIKLSATCDVTVYFNDSTKKIAVDAPNLATADVINSLTVAGDPGLCTSNYDPADTANDMTETGNKIYTITYTGISAGSYHFYIVANHQFNMHWNADGEFSGTPIDSIVGEDNATVVITIDISKFNQAEKTGSVSVDFDAPQVVSYDITYNLEGGINAKSNPQSYTRFDSDITIEEPTRPGFIFTGWTGSNGTEEQKNVTIQKGSSEEKTYTAHWKPIDYKIHYEANSGKGEMPDESVLYNTDSEAAENKFSKSNYSFAGWSLTDNGDVYIEEKGTISWDDFQKRANNNVVTLYAKWHENSAGLVYAHTEGGNNSSNEENVGVETGSVQGSTAIADEGYEFVNWTDRNGKVVSDKKTIIPSKNGSGIYESMTYTSNFKKLTYTVSCNTYIGDIAEPEAGTVTGSGKVDYGKSVTLYALPAAGSHFVEWKKDDETVSRNTSYTIENIREDLNYSAIFEWNKYVINFDKNAEDAYGIMQDESFVYNDSLKCLNSNLYARNGYTFAGWSADKNDTLPEYYDMENVKNIVNGYSGTLYAIWKENDKVSINYVSSDKNMGDVSVTDEYLAPATGKAKGSTAQAEEGFHFINWTDKNENVVSRDKLLVPIKNSNTGIYEADAYTANFALNNYKIIFNVNGGNCNVKELYTASGWKLQELPEAVRKGYKFDGWFSTADGGMKISANTIFKDDCEIYAHWEKNIEKEESDLKDDSAGDVEINNESNGKLLHIKTADDTLSNAGGKIVLKSSDVKKGDTITLSVEPDEGYKLKAIYVNNVNINGYTFIMPDMDVVVSAEFIKISQVDEKTESNDNTVENQKTNESEKTNLISESGSSKKSYSKTDKTEKKYDSNRIPETGDKNFPEDAALLLFSSFGIFAYIIKKSGL